MSIKPLVSAAITAVILVGLGSEETYACSIPPKLNIVPPAQLVKFTQRMGWAVVTEAEERKKAGKKSAGQLAGSGLIGVIHFKFLKVLDGDVQDTFQLELTDYDPERDIRNYEMARGGLCDYGPRHRVFWRALINGKNQENPNPVYRQHWLNTLRKQYAAPLLSKGYSQDILFFLQEKGGIAIAEPQVCDPKAFGKMTRGLSPSQTLVDPMTDEPIDLCLLLCAKQT